MKSLVKVVLALALCGLLIACSKNDISPPAGGSGQMPSGLFAQQSTTQLDNPNSPIGLWESNKITDQVEGDTAAFVIRLDIRQSKVNLTTSCTYRGTTLYAKTSASISELDKNGMDVNYSNSDSNNNGVFTCTASIKAGKSRFKIENGLMSSRQLGQNNILRKIGN